ncbi:Hypothetical protein LUCI_0764 [Lucifera butyrica]|uniref:Uncharacterized protein n=1 Tax=Lucifera butyrica TaxID=1351585 RepID=A0A498R262_9FIRM|nr:hypothetical protein [Lucifera butyrica]VBB05554.1 Hypothetical protein LUCI_0764 [Lucifera butyrica]
MKEKFIAFIREHWKYLVGLALVLALLVFGYREYQQWKQHILEQAQKSTVPTINVTTTGASAKADDLKTVYIQGQNTVTHEIVYVPKETTTVQQPDGTIKQVQEKTDVQFDNRQGKIYVKVNGKDYEVPDNVQENTKFENGKLVITDQSEIHINVTTPKPVMNAGVGWSRNGPALEINGPLTGSISWWAYGDKKTIVGGIQFPIMK